MPDIEGKWGGIAGPIGLGFRVPLLVVGPFARGGFLCSDVFDHTSLLRFLETRFGAEVPNLSEWRRETTGDLTSTLNLKEPDTSKGKLAQGRTHPTGRIGRGMRDHRSAGPAAELLPRTACTHLAHAKRPLTAGVASGRG